MTTISEMWPRVESLLEVITASFEPIFFAIPPRFAMEGVSPEPETPITRSSVPTAGVVVSPTT